MAGRMKIKQRVWMSCVYGALSMVNIPPQTNTLNKISNWSLFKLIISDQALITLK